MTRARAVPDAGSPPRVRGTLRAPCGAPDPSAPQGRGDERPLVTALWREAGGATSGFDPARFAVSLQRPEGWRAADVCASGCWDRPPHLCWFSALGAVVRAQRERRRPVRAAEGDALFGAEAAS
jgi:hypothetical protein